MLRYCFRLLAIAALLGSSCNTQHVPVRALYEGYPITSGLPVDSGLVQLLQPYRDSVNRSMSDVIGVLEKSLEKGQPEGTLGNFMADALLHMAGEKFGLTPDAAVVNSGGIRLTQLAAGPLTRGKIYELMPFDNLVVLQKVKGDVLQQFLDHTATLGGWPLAGISLQIREGKAVSVKVGGQPLDPARTYTLANTDYVANGGDNAFMLKALPQQNKGYLFRDALLDYIRLFTAQGKPIKVNEQKRVYAQ